MRKLFFVFSFLLLTSMVLVACGSTSQRNTSQANQSQTQSSTKGSDQQGRDKNQEDKNKDKTGKSHTVVIDPGHQEAAMNDLEPIGPGASQSKPMLASGTTGAVTGVPEYKLTLDVS